MPGSSAGAAGTWRAVAITYTYASKTLTFSYPRCKHVDPELPRTRLAIQWATPAPDSVGAIRMAYACRALTTT